MGNLTRDAELRKKGDAASVLTFGLAINEKKKDSERGGRKLLTADAPLLSRSSSPTGTVGRMRTVGNMRRSLTITSGTTS